MDGGVSFRNAVIFGIGVGIGHLVVHATYSLMLTGTRERRAGRPAS